MKAILATLLLAAATQAADRKPNFIFVIADDHPIFRRGLREVLDGHPAFEVVAEAGSGLEALEALRALRPRIGVLDVSMPELDGLGLLGLLGRPRVNVLLVNLDLDGLLR